VAAGRRNPMPSQLMQAKHSVVDEIGVEAVDLLCDDPGQLEEHRVDLRLANGFG